MDAELVRDLIHKLFNPDSGAVPIIHPEFKALGRLWIPWQLVVRTSGLERYLTNHPHAPSLCVLFQNGRCNSRDKCNQIHVDVQFATLVSEALHLNAVSNCCRMHGDLGSASNDIFATLKTDIIEIRMPGMQSLTVSTDRVAATFFWNRFVKEKRRVLFFSPDRVCNLHQQNQCKYGVECKNVHVCRDYWSEVANAMNNMNGDFNALKMQFESRPAAYHNLRSPVSMPNAMAVSEALNRMRPLGFMADPGVSALGSVPLAAPKGPEPKPKPKRASCALAIVDPNSGEEVTLTKTQAEEGPSQPSAPAMGAAPGPVGPRTPPPMSPLSPVNTAAFAAGSSLFMSFPSLFAGASDDVFSPLSTTAPTLPSSPWGVDGDSSFVREVRGMSLEDSPPKGAQPPLAKARAGIEAKGQGLTLQIQQVEDHSPPSSTGSPGNSPSPLSPTDCPFQSRMFPKPEVPASPLVAMVSPTRPTMQDDVEWLLKSEASRGKFRGLSSPLLGVSVADGPDSQKGFGAGRGWI